MKYNIKEVAERLRGLRLDLDLSIEDFVQRLAFQLRVRTD